jgi:hypothetical protein
LVGEHKGERTLGRTGLKLRDIIEVSLKEIGKEREEISALDKSL